MVNHWGFGRVSESAWVGANGAVTAQLALHFAGGVVSDGRHRGSWLSVLYALYILPVGLLFIAVATDQLSFSLMLLFAVSFGTISAFVQPARESLLGYADQNLMHQAVAKVVAVQFVAQGVGFSLLVRSEIWVYCHY